MAQNENNQECQSLVTRLAGTPTRDTCSGTSGTTELDLSFPLKDNLVPRAWHKPYTEALQETDPSKMAALILVAERAILNRSVEIQTFPTPIEESHDLKSALSKRGRRTKMAQALSQRPTSETRVLKMLSRGAPMMEVLNERGSVSPHSRMLRVLQERRDS